MLKNDIPEFLIKMLKKQYKEETINQILSGYNTKRYVSFRVNTIKSENDKIEKTLKEMKIGYEKVVWSDDAYIIKNARENELKNTQMYINGEIYLQNLSSMLPPIVLEPKPENDILDMAAAPGGKTTQIAALTNNKAHITATELNAIRIKRLKYNLEKQGVTSVFVMQKDARNIDDFFSFDQILLDAPCSGSGTISIDDKNISKFTEKFINKLVQTQIALLKKAITILKPGKEMIYSTCSILECENEEIINKVLKGTCCEIVPIQFEGKEKLPLLPTKIDGTICVCPNELYEGFFIAKIRKNLN